MSVKMEGRLLIDGLEYRAEKIYGGGDFEIGDCTLMGEAAEELERGRAHLAAMCGWFDILAELVKWKPENAGAAFDSYRAARKHLVKFEKCDPTLTVCPRCGNNIAKCDGTFHSQGVDS